jgi:hypothetical protein
MGLFRKIRAVERNARDGAHPLPVPGIEQTQIPRPQHCVHAQLLNDVKRKRFANRLV